MDLQDKCATHGGGARPFQFVRAGMAAYDERVMNRTPSEPARPVTDIDQIGPVFRQEGRAPGRQRLGQGIQSDGADEGQAKPTTLKAATAIADYMRQVHTGACLSRRP